MERLARQLEAAVATAAQTSPASSSKSPEKKPVEAKPKPVETKSKPVEEKPKPDENMTELDLKVIPDCYLLMLVSALCFIFEHRVGMKSSSDLFLVCEISKYK